MLNNELMGKMKKNEPNIDLFGLGYILYLWGSKNLGP